MNDEPIGAPELPMHVDERTIRAPIDDDVSAVVQGLARVHHVEIVALSERRRRLGLRTHLFVRARGSAADLRDFWQGVDEILRGRRSIFEWLDALVWWT